MSRHDVFAKKLKSSLLLFVGSVVLISTLLATSSAIYNASAASSDHVGSTYSARAKLIFQSIKQCIHQRNKASVGKNFNIGWSGLSDGYYLEANVEGHFNDGTYSCTDLGKGETLNNILSFVGLQRGDVLCNHSDYTKFGIVEGKSDKQCWTYINETDTVYIADEDAAVNYLYNVFRDKVFGGNVPGNSLDSFTDKERYFLYLDAFKTACVSGEGSFGSDNGVKIIEWNPSTNKYEYKAYSSNSNYDSNRNIKLRKNNDDIDAMNCQNLRTNLDPSSGSLETAALRNELQEACQEKYDSEVEKIKTWWSENKDNYSSANPNFVSAADQFLATYNVGAKAWEMDAGSNINSTCVELDKFSSGWEELLNTYGVTDAPTADTSYLDSVKPIATQTVTTSVESNCHSSAGSIGWILCPVLEFSAKAADWAYTTVVEPRLHTDPELFQITGDRNGTYQAWGIFRDLANIIFVIIFLIVIISQLTGHGIDNYGIKKILPNLIIAAILVNVSFYICQGLVDLSNIAGSGIYDELSRAALRIGIPSSSVVASDSTSIVVAVIGVIAGAGIATAVGGAAFWTMVGSALLAVVPAVLGAVISILFLFVLLAMRQAVVVILVAISPLAFVAYVLPNTKSLFDRWGKILRGMLLVYPISALLIAGGRLASRIIFSAGGGNDLGVMLTAMAAEIAPLFFIPTVVRSAYRVTGQLGARLNGIGQGLTRGMRARVEGSNTYRYAEQQARKARANATITRHQRRYGVGATPPTGANAVSRALYGVRNMGYQQAQQTSQAAVNAYQGMYAESDRVALNDELKDALSKLDPQRFAAAFRTLLQKGGKEEALQTLYDNPAAMNDPLMRANIEREMGNSGLTFMKEFLKFKAEPGNANATFSDFVDSGALAAKLNSKGETAIAGLDKDEYSFMATAAKKNNAAFSSLAPEIVARAATSLTASDQAAKFNEFLSNMKYNDTQQQAIANKISIAGAATMFNSTRETLSTAVTTRRGPVGQVRARFSAQFDELRNNRDHYANTIAQMRDDDRTNYVN